MQELIQENTQKNYQKSNFIGPLNENENKINLDLVYKNKDEN